MSDKDKKAPEAGANPPADNNPPANESSGKVSKARALVDCVVDGKAYRCNELVTGSAKAIKQAEKEGVVDSNSAAVAVVEAPPAEAEE